MNRTRINWIVSSVFLLVLIGGCAVPQSAQILCKPVILTHQPENDTSANLTRIASHITGSVTRVVVHEGYLYLQVGTDLVILDVRDPPEPVEVAVLSSSYVPQTITNNKAYLSWHGQMQTIDVFNPEELVGSACPNHNSPNLVRATFVDGYAYDPGTSLTIYDVSNLHMPIEISSFQAESLPYFWTGFRDREWFPRIIYHDPVELRTISVAIADNHAFLGTGQFALDSWSSGHLAVLDVSNPYEPERVTTLAMPESAVPLSIVIEGNYAFVSSSGQWITDATFIFDISNPRHPVQVARIPNGVFFGVHNGNAYLYNAGSGLDVWDVSNPLEPIFQVTIELPLTYWADLNVYVNDIRDIAFDDDYAYIALNELGLHILDISNPNIAEVVGIIRYGNPPLE